MHLIPRPSRPPVFIDVRVSFARHRIPLCASVCVYMCFPCPCVCVCVYVCLSKVGLYWIASPLRPSGSVCVSVCRCMYADSGCLEGVVASRENIYLSRRAGRASPLVGPWPPLRRCCPDDVSCSVGIIPNSSELPGRGFLTTESLISISSGIAICIDCVVLGWLSVVSQAAVAICLSIFLIYGT